MKRYIKGLALPRILETKEAYAERTGVALSRVEWVDLCEYAADLMHDKYLAERRVLEGLPPVG